MMTTTEGNKLIAEFMGVTGCSFNPVDGYDFGTWYKPDSEADDSYIPSPILYQSSWGWLMPVVAKIVNELPQFDNETKTEKVLQALLSANIYEVYNSVVEFITWYNEQNRTDM